MRRSSIIFIIVAVLAAIAAMSWDRATIERRRFEAVVLDLRQDMHKQTAEIRQIAISTLPDGGRIEAVVKTGKPVEKGDRVTIVERTDPFGLVTYRVVDSR